MSLSKQVVKDIVLLYDWVWETGIDCENCDYKYLVREPHGEVTRHCAVEDTMYECPVVDNAILETRVGGSKQ